MLKKLKSSIIMLVLLVLLTGCVNQNQTHQTQDMTIAATSVTVTQILEALGVDSSMVVGIPTSESYEVPSIYQNATELGTAMSPDIEILSDLKPDLILSPNSLESDLAQKYENIGIESAFLNLKNVNGMFKSIEELGQLLNKEEQANALVDEFVTYMNQFETATVKPNVLILMGLPGSYVVATESSYVGNLVKLAGANNIYGDGDGQDFVSVNPEDMLKKNPDIILRTSHALPEQVKMMFEEEFTTNQIWTNFTAVQNNKVYDLSNEQFGMSANFEYQEALEYLKGILYENN